MSAAFQPSLELLQNQEVLGELLHSLSQPLTSLRCSLELSIDEVADRQQATVSVALQQTEKVIGMIQLMRSISMPSNPDRKLTRWRWHRRWGRWLQGCHRWQRCAASSCP